MIDGITIKNDDLHRPWQLEYSLNFSLDFGQIGRSWARLFKNRSFRRIVQHGLLPQRNVRRHPRDDDPTLELVLQELEDGLLHHVRHFVALEGGPNQDQGPEKYLTWMSKNIWHYVPDARHHVVGGQSLLLLAQEPLQNILFINSSGEIKSVSLNLFRWCHFALSSEFISLRLWTCNERSSLRTWTRSKTQTSSSSKNNAHIHMSYKVCPFNFVNKEDKLCSSNIKTFHC